MCFKKIKGAIISASILNLRRLYTYNNKEPSAVDSHYSYSRHIEHINATKIYSLRAYSMVEFDQVLVVRGTTLARKVVPERSSSLHTLGYDDYWHTYVCQPNHQSLMTLTCAAFRTTQPPTDIIESI